MSARDDWDVVELLYEKLRKQHRTTELEHVTA